MVYNDARLVPQTYRGTQLVSSDIENLTLTAGGLDQFKLRDSTDSRSIIPDGYAGRNGGSFIYAGGEYNWARELRASYFYGEMEDFYHQQFAGLQHTLAVPLGKMTTDVRYFFSRDDGKAYAGDIDNNLFSAQVSYATVGHVVGVSYQRLQGDAGLPYVNGASVYSFSNMGIGKFIEEDETSWLVSYGYDFRHLGIAGLNFMTRYIRGEDRKSEGVDEWERDIELAYSVPAGALKGLGVKLRNYVYRSNTARGRDSNRFYMTYDIAIW